MIPILIGYDPREACVNSVLEHSLISHSSEPLALIPLHSPLLGNFDGQQDGTNAFIYSRFLACELMDFGGWAIYMDSDMMLRADIKELWDLRDDSKAVMVVKHDYETVATKKFVGTPIEAKNESYPRKNWSSLILWNCGHPKNKILTREFVGTAGGAVLHRFSWLNDDEIGEIPKEWNHLVGEYPYDAKASNVHFTLGAPGFKQYYCSDYSEEWHRHLLGAVNMIGEDQDKMMWRAKHGRHLRSISSV